MVVCLALDKVHPQAGLTNGSQGHQFHTFFLEQCTALCVAGVCAKTLMLVHATHNFTVWRKPCVASHTVKELRSSNAT